MTLILSGTNGLSDVDGDASTPAVRGTDANSGIFFGADTVGVSTGGSEKVSVGASAVVVNDGGADVDFRVEGDTDANLLFVDASTDRVGINTNAPGTKLHIQGDHVSSNGLLRLNANAGQRYATLSLWNDTTFKGALTHDNNNNSFELYATSGQQLRFFTDDALRMSIDTSGNLLVGTTGVPNGTSIYGSGFVPITFGRTRLSMATNNTGNLQLVNFFNPNGEVGSINTSGSATAYNTSSDYRLKNITGPITNSGAYIDSLNPVEGTWKADGSTFVGLIAHEVQEVSRTIVATGEKDGEEMQGMDYSSAEIIANLIAEVKSLRTRVAELEAK